MKRNQIPFKSDENDLGRQKAINWLSQFNVNLSVEKKIRDWKIELKESIFLLIFFTKE